MRVGLYDVDSRIPNLALMRLAAYHRARGDDVELYSPLWLSTYDRIYASKVFKTGPLSDDSLLLEDRMVIGGTGWDLKTTLPAEVEACDPDYTLYNYPHSIGFTQRGCRFRCKFCVVPEKEGRPSGSSTIPEIWTNRESDFIVLLDNDFFGGPQWKDRIEELKAYRLRVNFSQGLNIRIITDEQAEALASVRFRSISGKTPMVHFAWDRIFDEKRIDAGIKRVLAAGVKPREMTFYILVGFDSTPEEDMYRIMKLRGLGINPFVMPYDSADPYQRRLARWVNHKAIFKTVSWGEYGHA